MKLTYFYATIEIIPRDGYSESLQCSTDREDTSKLKFTFPYGEITPEQAVAVAEFTKTLTSAFNKLQKQIDSANKDLKLEQYAPKSLTASGSDFDLDAKTASNSAVPQDARGVSNQESVAEQIGRDYEEAVEEVQGEINVLEEKF